MYEENEEPSEEEIMRRGEAMRRLLAAMPLDAVKIIVRGFHDRGTGERIIGVLKSLGFRVTSAVDETSDTIGGIIETEIMPSIELEADDVDEIKKQIYEAVDEQGLFCQWVTYVTRTDSSDEGI